MFVDKLPPGMLLWPAVHHVVEKVVHGWCWVVFAVVENERVGVMDGECSHQLL
jgi:hypothetical protein